jgi:hypothetical protein
MTEEPVVEDFELFRLFAEAKKKQAALSVAMKAAEEALARYESGRATADDIPADRALDAELKRTQAELSKANAGIMARMMKQMTPEDAQKCREELAARGLDVDV